MLYHKWVPVGVGRTERRSITSETAKARGQKVVKTKKKKKKRGNIGLLGEKRRAP